MEETVQEAIARKRAISEKAKVTREETLKQEVYDNEVIPVILDLKRIVDSSLEHKLERIGMTKSSFMLGCIRSYLKGEFKMLDGELLFVRDTHSLEEIRKRTI